MKIAHAFLLIVLLIAQSATAAPQVLLKGDVSCFGILTEDLQDDLGVKITRDSAGTAHVDRVSLGSEAYRKGLKQGDQVIDAGHDSKSIYIKIKRDGKVYEASLGGDPPRPQFRAQVPQLDPHGQESFKLKANQFHGYAVTSQQVATLANYDLEIIIDRSMSMMRPDCPGGLSRWDWCAGQAIATARALSALKGVTPTVTRFATDFDVHEHASPDTVSQLLSRRDFQFGTCLADPLYDRINNHFTRRRKGQKPLLIAVITDGVPYPRPQPRLVVETLVNASYYMANAREMTIVFLQVGGDDPRGRSFLQRVGTQLVNRGARHQYVHTKTFEEIQSVGLAQALVDSVNQYSPRSAYAVGERTAAHGF